MKSGIFRSVFSFGLLLCCLITTLQSHARNHSDFVTMQLPAPFTLETAIGFGQDGNGQVWFVTESGVSVFRDGVFLPIKNFGLNAPVVSFVVVDHALFLATREGVYSLSLAQPATPIKAIWQANSQEQPRELLVSEPDNGSAALWLKTNRGIYFQTLTSDTSSSSWQNIFSYAEELRLALYADTSGLYFSNRNNLRFYSLEQAGLETRQLNFNVKQLVKDKGNLFAVTQENLLVPLNDQGTGESYSLPESTSLIQGQERLYLRQQGKIQSLNQDLSLTDDYQALQTFIDDRQNIWLSTPYDIQVAWYQPVPVYQIETPNWAATINEQLILINELWAYTNGQLVELDGNGLLTNRWTANMAEGETLADVLQVWSQEKFIWFNTANHLYALDRSSGAIRVQIALSRDSIVLPYLHEQALIVNTQQMLVVNGSSSIQLLKDTPQCSANCLPDYRIYHHYIAKDGIWLGTNQGLHKFEFEGAEFSSERLDLLNQTAPVIYLHSAGDSAMWLVYPNKIALFQADKHTSDIYYSQHSRIFDARIDADNSLMFRSQSGWHVARPNIVSAAKNDNVLIQQQVDNGSSTGFAAIDQELSLTSNATELQLAFFMASHHPSQDFFVRFKYDDEATWSEVSNGRYDLVLKDLRQGRNRLLVQARLEGKHWQEVKTVDYFLPFRFFQTKWVLAFVALFLLILLGVVAYERMRRINVVFKSMKQQAFISSLLESTHEGVWIADKDRNIQSVNKAFEKITGFKQDDVNGSHFQLLTDSGRNHEVESLIWQEVIKSGFWSGEVWSKKSSGDKLSIDLSVTRVESEDKILGKTDVKFVGVFSDVTSRKQNESDLRHLATRDPLTNLANRTLFIEHVKHSINTATKVTPHFAVMFIDLDNFKKVNESLGLLQGDELIKLVGQRIEGVLEKGVSLARLGGDEFALLIPNHLLSGVPAFYIKRVAADLQRVLQPSFQLADAEVNITTSMGVAIYPSHGEKVEFLMRCADTALNRAKSSGRNNCLVYDHLMDDVASDKLNLESELISALNNQEFLVYYQPKYKMKENRVSGFEALVRWQNPNRGLVPPDQFISIAEDNGLIRQLDSCVLQQVCIQIKKWLELGFMPGKVAVNISALNFQQADFCDHIRELVAQEGDLAQYIELEITETAMMQDPEKALRSIETLREQGFSIALDDFGTGHSSLGYLKKFPIDRIKIDRTFVKEIEISSQDRNITSVIVQLAKHLDIAVIAEGIENEQQAYMLHIMGCNEIQGYFISRPIPAEQVPTFLMEELKKIEHIVS